VWDNYRPGINSILNSYFLRTFLLVGCDTVSMAGDGDSVENPKIAHVLIRSAAQLTSYDELSDPTSVESSVARSRGGGELTEKETNEQPASDEGGHIRFNEGKINPDTGYVMRFVKPSQRDLTIYDVISIPENTAYPVAEETLESLPPWARSMISEDGHVKLSGEYDRDSREFRHVQQGWNKYYNPYDRLVEMARAADGDMLAAAYFLINKYGSDQYAHPETIADVRDIQQKSVVDAINRIKNLEDIDEL